MRKLNDTIDYTTRDTDISVVHVTFRVRNCPLATLQSIHIDILGDSVREILNFYPGVYEHLTEQYKYVEKSIMTSESLKHRDDYKTKFTLDDPLPDSSEYYPQVELF